MKPLYKEEDFIKAKANELFPCECYECNKIFYKEKRAINKVLRNIKHHIGKYCSLECYGKAKNKKEIVECKNCGIKFEKARNQIKKSPNHFCTSSCAGIYNSQHKTHGTRRSKLEIWLEQQLPILYPNLEFHFNRKDTINSELDIYIPSLKLAFELNGIFHYEPIYGIEQLNKIQNNDNRKFQACLEHNIELCIIDTSKQKYFKEQTSIQYLDIIKNIVLMKICGE